MCNLSTSSSRELLCFIQRLFHFLVVLIMVITVFWMIGHKVASQNSSYSSIVLKHELLRESTNPRIILTGGSGTLHGYDSGLLHELTGYSVINVALTMQTGLSFLMNEIQYYSQSGDIIILSPEYHYFLKDQTDYRLLAEIVMYDIRSIVSVDQPFKILKPLMFELLRITRLSTGNLLNNQDFSRYTRKSITNYGDLNDACHTGHLAFGDSWLNDLEIQDKYPEHAYSLITETANYCDSIGAHLLIFFPAVIDSFYTKPEISGLAANMRESIDAIFLCEPEMCVYDDTMFYNSIYHLNSEAAVLRTLQLYSLLTAYL